MGSLAAAAAEDEDPAAMFLADSELLISDPSPFISSSSAHWQQSASIFDCGGLIKDWGNPPNSATGFANSTPFLTSSSTTTTTTTQDHHNSSSSSSLYIDPCSDLGDVFFSSSYQTTPISVLDYVQQSSAEDCGGIFQQEGVEGDALEIQEMLDGFTSHLQQQQQQLHDHDQFHLEEIEHSIPQQILQGSSMIPCTSPSTSTSRISSSQGSSFTTPVAPLPVTSSPAYLVATSAASNPIKSEQEHQLQQQRQQQVFATPKAEQQQQQQQQQQSNSHRKLIPKQEIVEHRSGGVSYHMNNSSSPAFLPKFEPMDQQLRLVRMLLSCANAVADENLDLAGAILVQLRSMVVPHGSPMERLASYVTEALVARLSRNTRSSSFKGLVCDKLQQMNSTTRSDMLEAFWVFYEYIPIGKFTHLTMNQILLEAADRERMIHVIDFQVWYGAQWPSFIQSLAMRPGGPPIVRMTAVGSSLRDLQEAGSKLLDCARGLSVPFEYCILNVELEQFHSGMIELRDGEAVLVNSLCQFHCFLKRDLGFLDQFLHGLRSLRPKLVVMAENDADHNSPVFLHRFMACLQYYSAVFDAFDASLHMPGILQGRKKLEELIAAQKLRNMIACEGSERVERHESMRAWNSRMEAVGFRAVSMSNKAINQASLLLRLYFSNGYTLTNEDGFLILGWRGMPLNGVGAWI